MRKIARSFYESKCYGQRYNKVTNEMEDVYVVLDGSIGSKEYATRQARKILKDDSVVIYNIEVDKSYYKISAENFKKYGERVY